tara:strand:+ start:1427 stop:1681 length:255 start_codon:yes stop_codon:yes gene_type:complete
MLNFKFENRLYAPTEIKTKFAIKDKTWDGFLGWHDKASQSKNKIKKIKKKNLEVMGIFKLPDTNYHVVEPIKFQDWFNDWIKSQ